MPILIDSCAIHVNGWENERHSNLIIRHVIPEDSGHQQAASPMSLLSAAYRSPPVRVSGGSVIPIAHEYGDGYCPSDSSSAIRRVVKTVS